MEYKDYYKVLGVDKKASEKEIKQAFRRLARKHHPDVNPNNKAAQDKFKEINEANDVLSDADKRRKYDALGANWQQYEQFQRGGGRGPFQWGSYRSAAPQDFESPFGNQEFDVSDFFRTFFSGGFEGATPRAANRARRGQDIEQALEITFEEAYRGTERIIQKDGRRLEIKIPAGMRSGSRIRYAGEGLPGFAGAPPGDMYFQIQVAPHADFERRDDDIYLQAQVDLYTAVLGGEITVPTLKGQGVLKIPAGTQSGKVFRLSGQGMSKLNERGKFGDMYVTAQVVVPENLSAPEKELFEKLAKIRKTKTA
ncbi:MAG: J domain-containing protein [Chloroflexi bacterium]|nr:J domain-containing protein [Chloroflexota bacterium]